MPLVPLVIQHPNYPPPNGSPAYRDLSDIIEEIIHHSAGSLSETPLEIDAQHRAQGWCMIGYDYVITPDGKIYQGRSLGMVPAAAEYANTISVDICLIGNFQSDDPGYTGEPTAAQIASLKALSIWLHQPEQGLALQRIIGHEDVARITGHPDAATACPGNKLYSLIPEIHAAVLAELNK